MGLSGGARSVWLWGVVAVALALVVAARGERSQAALPPPEGLAPNTVVLVSEVPRRRGTITKVEFRHALELAAVQAEHTPVPRPGENGYGQLAEQALRSLLEAIWVWGEAAERGISVTHRQVSRQVALVKEENFKSGAEFRRFLRETHYTRRDVNERVELQLLSLGLQAWLQRRVDRESRTGAEEQQAFRDFLTEFNERWRARTVCAPDYATDLCSNGPPPGVVAGA